MDLKDTISMDDFGAMPVKGLTLILPTTNMYAPRTEISTSQANDTYHAINEKKLYADLNFDLTAVKREY